MLGGTCMRALYSSVGHPTPLYREFTLLRSPTLLLAENRLPSILSPFPCYNTW